jgi:hypothetical protein
LSTLFHQSLASAGSRRRIAFRVLVGVSAMRTQVPCLAGLPLGSPARHPGACLPQSLC